MDKDAIWNFACPRIFPTILEKLEREIENLPGVRTVADDIIIYGEGQTIENATLDHDRKLKALLDRCRERNIKINRDKLVLRATEMPYIGHLLTAEGVKPDPEKIAAIVNMEKPTNVKGVQRLLEKGLGASLMQDSQPIAYASRALTKTEQNYAQIEKELLAVVFGMEKFHQYTYGRKVYVESDHKPLESLYKKPLYHAPKRLQRMFLRLQRYDIELKYKQGKYLYIADTLSRAYLRSTDGNESKNTRRKYSWCAPT
ncbi:Hypothetical predicted protein [Mytilus galloprovincialis]|uniref:Reverse transcriptase RNase H-like domain-containing protein n=1 Tax=Mytilus galloprovincialis TaxID=29158 RepID=A0A8B6G2K1_MYTGA|nr:Hypothetical predicted protein [Mytilus galloprovincialis]